jgi:hypothetical protein
MSAILNVRATSSFGRLRPPVVTAYDPEQTLACNVLQPLQLTDCALPMWESTSSSDVFSLHTILFFHVTLDGT